MKARIEAGWDFEKLWDRCVDAETGDGYVYDYAGQMDPVAWVSVED